MADMTGDLVCVGQRSAVDADGIASGASHLPSTLLIDRRLMLFQNDCEGAKRMLLLARERDILVPHTQLFRLPEMRLIPELLADSDSEFVPILSYGCSTGEEPYSMHLLLRKYFGECYYEKYPVWGFDKDLQSLLRAREGRISLSNHIREGGPQTRALELGVTVDYSQGYDCPAALVPDRCRVLFREHDIRQGFRPEFTQTAVMFFANMLYHLHYDDLIAVLDAICTIPQGSMVVFGRDTSTDFAVVRILQETNMFQKVNDDMQILLKI